MAIVNRVLPDDNGIRVFPPEVYLVCGYKRNLRAHCLTVDVTSNEKVVAHENGYDFGTDNFM